MTIKFEHNDYGESRIRLLRVNHLEGRHEIKDLELSVRFEGEFESAHTGGDNRKILPPDSMKNTVHVLAKQYPSEAVEDFCLHLVEHFLTYNPQVSRVHVSATERLWVRLEVGDKPHPTAFAGGTGEKRTARITATRERTELHSGIEDFSLLKTAGAAFLGFIRDPYTTLEVSPEGSFSATLSTEWSYAEEEPPYSTIWHGVRKILLETFAFHEDRSPQHLLHALGHAVLDNFAALDEIRLTLRVLPLRLLDLKPFGIETNEEIYDLSDASHSVANVLLRRQP